MANEQSTVGSPAFRRWKLAIAAAVAVLAVVARLVAAPTVSSLPAVSSASKAASSGASATGVPPGLSASASKPAKAGTPPPVAKAAPVVSTPARIALGKAIFFDPSLSEPPGTSCAACHDPARGYAGNHGSTNGVALGSRPAHFSKRNAPSVLYLGSIHRFHVHWEEDVDLPDPVGGFFWDGRVDSITDLVKEPLLDPDEMNNRDAAQIAEKVRAGAYAADFRREFGAGLDDPDAALKALGQAVEAFLTSPAMSPFTSKYDDFVRGQAKLSPLEERGLALFRDHRKGACNACHVVHPNIPDPRRSPFTNYKFDVVAIPRNPRIPANADPARFDLGLCQVPKPKYRSDEERLCGAFRTPSLRNVATRPSFMHNGAFTRLRDAVAFYASRGTDPKRWYKGGVEFDDVPARYREYVNVQEAPYNRRRGQPAALDDGEIDAIVAFLQTLTDARVDVAGAGVAGSDSRGATTPQSDVPSTVPPSPE